MLVGWNVSGTRKRSKITTGAAKETLAVRWYVCLQAVVPQAALNNVFGSQRLTTEYFLSVARGDN